MNYDGQTFTNISATTATFQLLGGYYCLDAHGTWGGGSIQLNRLAADGSTWIAAGNPITADGAINYLLPPGRYQIAVTTATALYIQLGRIPVQ